jgi:hypothetical protein
VTTHQGEADLTLTPEGKIRVLENRVKDLEATVLEQQRTLDKLRTFPGMAQMEWSPESVQQWIAAPDNHC